MRIDLSKDPIVVTREDGRYDAFVQDFVARIPDDWTYVLVSGYVALLFGRERHTEDIDMLVAPPTDEQFAALWSALHPDHWCLQTDDPAAARDDYLRGGIALRFARAGEIEPNMEFKLAHDAPGRHALAHRRAVRLNGYLLWVPPFEQQYAYKLWLGSDKDLEDAVHLRATLGESMKADRIRYWLDELRVPAATREAMDL